MGKTESTEETILFREVAVLLKDGTPGDVFISKNLDIQYLGRKSGLPPPFIRRMECWFGGAITTEALRRYRRGWDEAIFVGVARNVERGMM